MTPSREKNPPQDAAAYSSKQRLPLMAAVGVAVIAGLILIYELVGIINGRVPAATVVASGASGSAPVPLSSQPFSFVNQPVAVADLKFIDGSERPLSLVDFKGRPVLLNIWATWCLPCRKEMPSLDRLQAKFDPAKFLVLALSIDRAGIPAVKKFYVDLGLKSLGMYVDPSGSAHQQLGLIGIPGTLLINSQGQEIGRKLGSAEWDSPAITALLREHFGLDAANATGETAP